VSAPSKLGKYAIRRELGRGAMGVVYEGFDPFIERTVAIKTIKPERPGEADAGDALARFRREAQAAGRLSHPNIVSIYEYGEQDGVAFIAMEFIKGKELKEFFESGRRFAARDVARIMGEILGALDHAHRNGVTHRDIKPANVIILENGAVKVADFGIARIGIDAGRHGARHAVLHVPRAVSRHARGWPQRHLFLRRHPVSVSHR